MLKVIGSNAWEGSLWGVDTPRAALLRYSLRSGLDKQAFVKRACASSEELLEKLASIEVKPGEELLHLIALGATESYGPNRNGDGFSKAACRKYHDTFVKNARVYRDHKNTDKSKSYGVVKASAFNEDMQRVELIVALNGTKEAAKANGGLVADKEMEKLARGEDIPVSMACFTNPDYPILTREHGYIPIKDVAVGDNVWTKDSGWKPVKSLVRRNYSGCVVKFSLQTAVEEFCELELTYGHELLTCTPFCSTEEWKPVECISSQDFLVCKIPNREDIRQSDTYKDYADKLFRLMEESRSDNGGDESLVLFNAVSKRYVEDIPVYNLEVEDDPSYLAGFIVSHNCSVPFDVCSCCGNKATTQAEYCKGTDEGGHCKAGGLRHNMGKLASLNGEIRQLFADNTQPSFFDISHVFVPADRIAYSSGRLTKSAAVREDVEFGGAELARRLCISCPATSEGVPALQFLKDAVAGFHRHELWQKRAAFLGVMNSKPLTDTQTPKRYKFAQLQRALQDAGVCLTATQFVQLAAGITAKQASYLGEVIAPLSNDAFEKMAEAWSPYGAEARAPSELHNWVRAQGLPSVFPDRFQKQAALASIAESPENTLTAEEVYSMADDEAVQEAAKSFAQYKLAFVAGLPRGLQEPTAELLVGRDYLSF